MSACIECGMDCECCNVIELNTENNRLKDKIKDLEADRKIIVRLDKKRKPRHPKFYFIGTRAEADEYIGHLSEDIAAMRHDLVSSENLWCTDSECNGKSIPDGFKLHHKSLEE